MTYSAPGREIAFCLRHVAGLVPRPHGASAGLDDELVESLLGEAGRFAGEVLAPLNHPGDRVGARYENGKVTLPPGFADAYRAWTRAGWNGVDLPAAWGGMGLPTSIATAVMEMWSSACLAFATTPVLTQGAVDCLAVHASDELKVRYLPKLVAGEWAAAMNLTEPQAGSDLSAVRTRAEPSGEGAYNISGQKIFITSGEHDLASNIVHLVLARLPQAPAGTRGISLFLVPKFLTEGTGATRRNGVRCAGIERKLGIHASPTCMMAFGDDAPATGWLVGAENHGLACMFTMMNKARLYTGLQGVAIAERATQQAVAYARTRRQGQAEGSRDNAMSPIIAHPDVRRMLLTMKCLTAAGRAIAYTAAQAIDRAHAGADAERAEAESEAALLTPIAKAFCADLGVEVASLGIQVHGGTGYVEETGAAQHFRDARIPPIYEGTNGIQAIDLVLRKIVRPGGATARRAIASCRAIAAATDTDPAFGAMGAIAREAVEALASATDWLLEPGRRPDELLAVASPYLRLFGLVLGGALLAKGAHAARRLSADGSDPMLTSAIASARFYAESILTGAPGLARTVRLGGASTLVDADLL